MVSGLHTHTGCVSGQSIQAQAGLGQALTSRRQPCASCTYHAVPFNTPSRQETSVSPGDQEPTLLVIARLAERPRHQPGWRGLGSAGGQHITGIDRAQQRQGKRPGPTPSASPATATAGSPTPRRFPGTASMVQPSLDQLLPHPGIPLAPLACSGR